MNKTPSQYEPYWELLKANRGKWIELAVPAEYHERIVKALRKRKGREHATTAKFYPNFEVIRQPVHPVTKKKQMNILLIMLPENPIDTI